MIDILIGIIMVLAFGVFSIVIYSLMVMSGRCSREEEKRIYEREARVQGRDTDSN